MARETEKPGGVDRRKFISGAGAFVTGSVATISACPPFVADGTEGSACRVLLHDAARCVGCGTCAMMCSLSHEGEVGPALSRAGIVRDPFTYDFTFNVCQQCIFPDCYFACPLRDRARRIEGWRGIIYVDESECIGCGNCVAACRFEPARTTMHPEERVALNCDRCRERDEGPVCVEYCPMNALSCSTLQRPRSSRRSGTRRGQSTHRPDPG